MSSPENILSTQNLSIGYSKDSVVARDINLAFAKGENIAVIGVNGSGKSTLLRSLSGLLPALSGEIRFRGSDIQSFAPETLSQKLSIVLTSQPISKNLSVSELVALGRQPYTNWLGRLTQNDKKAIYDALEATQLLELKNRKCHTLSDGQLQRALIARALAQDTDIIVLDEPTTHLDLHHKASIFQLLKKFSQELGKTMIFATHDIELVLPLCDKMVIIKDGKTIFDTPENLVSCGHFDDLFPSKIVAFDREQKRFLIKDNS